MKILILALGSRGDVQPFLALAVGLRDAGHHVTLAAPYNYREWIVSYGIHFHPARFNPHEMLQRPEVQKMIKSRNVVRQIRVITEFVRPGLLQSLDDFWEAGQSADFVVQTGTGYGGSEIAQLRGIPLALAFLQPFHRTSAFPSFFLPIRGSLGRWYNRLTHRVMNAALWPSMGPPANEWRRTRFQLPPFKSLPDLFAYSQQVNAPILYGYSPSALPKPADWGEQMHVAGYWFLDGPPDWQPPADLLHFLESGSPPVYIGFGSMRDDDPEQLTQLALRALELSGQRGIFLTGWGGLSQTASERVFVVDNVPHAWLFPRMAAVVHHGGAGTTAAGFRAGVPNLITPFALDQYAWADLATELGVRPKNLGGIKRLTAEKLADAIRVAVHDEGLKARATALGQQIRAENGVARAVEIIEQHASR
ncbi:MAG: glycosyltransferase [Chloroflexi bacterium]|nr:glycosyltransferase [Chloroflexota bacterium]